MHEKTAVPTPIVGAIGEQPLEKEFEYSIADHPAECKDNSAELLRKLRRMQEPGYLHTVTLNDLYDNVYEGFPAVVDGLLWPGTYLFVGPPKVGKSFLVAQIAYHVSMGLPLWNMQVDRGTVLYLALEDDYRRLQRRLYRMFGTEGTEKLHFSINAKHIGEGLDEQLERFVRENPDTKLIIVDTLQKIREIGSDKYSYANDYELIARLKSFAQSHGICLLLVHHTRKQKADDIFDTISGTNGLLGASDGAFIMQRHPVAYSKAYLSISGRDQQSQTMVLERNAERLNWELEEIMAEIWEEPKDSILEAIHALLEESPSWQGNATELAEAIGQEISPISLTKRLNVNVDRLRNEYRIRYKWSRTHTGRVITLKRINPEA